MKAREAALCLLGAALVAGDLARLAWAGLVRGERLGSARRRAAVVGERVVMNEAPGRARKGGDHG